ncbi:putative transglycosylase [Rhodococcus sp. MTM3W5.2]|nr:putative transglycosylase [Rhodococcus sp. MTM3W5.2]
MTIPGRISTFRGGGGGGSGAGGTNTGGAGASAGVHHPAQAGPPGPPGPAGVAPVAPSHPCWCGNRHRCRPRIRGHTRLAADGLRPREGLEVGALQRAVHRALPDVRGQPGTVNRSAPLVHDRLRLLGTDPDRGGQRRRVADHPGILVHSGVAELRGPGLGGRRPASVQCVPVRVDRDRQHRLGDVVGHRRVESPFPLRRRTIQQHRAVRSHHPLHEVGLMVDPGRGQRRIRGRHVDRTGLVLPQDDSVLRRAAVLGQALALDAGDLLRDAGLVRDVGDLLRAVLHRQREPVEAGVQRLLERLRDGAGPAAVAAHVRDLHLTDGERGTVEHRLQALALLEQGGQPEHLECGSGLQRRLREIETGPVGSAVVRADRAAARIDRHHRRAQLRGLARHRLAHRLQRRVLRPRVDGGGDLQPLGVQLLLADPGRGQLGEHLRPDQAFRSARRVRIHQLTRRHHRREQRRGPLLLRQLALADHSVEHVPPAGLEPGAVGLGVEAGRALDDGGEHGALLDRELLDRLVEVGLRCGRDAVRAAAEVDGVQVGGEDVVLGPLPGHLRGDDQLTHLADDVPVRADEGVLDVLLGDRRTAARAGLAEDVVACGPGKAGDGEAWVGVEVPILGGQDRLPDVLGICASSTSVRLPSGGTTFVMVEPSVAKIVATWLVRMSEGCGTSACQ